MCGMLEQTWVAGRRTSCTPCNNASRSVLFCRSCSLQKIKVRRTVQSVFVFCLLCKNIVRTVNNKTIKINSPRGHCSVVYGYQYQIGLVQYFFAVLNQLLDVTVSHDNGLRYSKGIPFVVLWPVSGFLKLFVESEGNTLRCPVMVGSLGSLAMHHEQSENT